jgi:hypothetical protein
MLHVAADQRMIRFDDGCCIPRMLSIETEQTNVKVCFVALRHYSLSFRVGIESYLVTVPVAQSTVRVDSFVVCVVLLL